MSTLEKNPGLLPDEIESIEHEIVGRLRTLYPQLSEAQAAWRVHSWLVYLESPNGRDGL